jgi:ubiquinone/menaquinone biosynthesis C-methylase UbiE/uncharacterized protein YbaR (Trm112 family)
MNYYEQFLQCTKCQSAIEYKDTHLSCVKCKAVYPIKNGIPDMLVGASEDLRLTIAKWNKIYVDKWENGTINADYAFYMQTYFDDIFRQVGEVANYKDSVYLEIGCGTFFFGREIAKDCSVVIGVDICESSLEIAKKLLDERNISNYLLLKADILDMPIKNESIDLLYGGGVIEHFPDTQKSVNEIYRVLSPGGVSYNTVPWLNIGALTYRQVWGNIPNFPVLKQAAEFIHMKVLGGRHMLYGYEFSFPISKMRKIHAKAGFKDITISKLEVKLTFDFIPERARKLFIKIATKTTIFWPMIKVIARK